MGEPAAPALPPGSLPPLAPPPLGPEPACDPALDPALPLPAFALVVPPLPGVGPEPPPAGPEPPTVPLPAVLLAPACGVLTTGCFSDELQATDKHTAHAPNSDNSSLVIIGSRIKKRAPSRHSIDK